MKETDQEGMHSHDGLGMGGDDVLTSTTIRKIRMGHRISRKSTNWKRKRQGELDGAVLWLT